MPESTITCKQCNYANEPERVYCHNCGAKLDRSILPKESPKNVKETAKESRKRIRKLVNPASGFLTNWHRSLINALCSAISIAALIQMARPPAGVPSIPTKDDLLGAPQLSQGIEDLQMNPTPQICQLKEAEINLYLATAIKTKGNTSDDYFKFDRAFVNLGNGVIKITAQESAFGHPIYAATSYKLSIAGGKLVATNVGEALAVFPSIP